MSRGRARTAVCALGWAVEGARPPSAPPLGVSRAAGAAREPPAASVNATLVELILIPWCTCFFLLYSGDSETGVASASVRAPRARASTKTWSKRQTVFQKAWRCTTSAWCWRAPRGVLYPLSSSLLGVVNGGVTAFTRFFMIRMAFARAASGIMIAHCNVPWMARNVIRRGFSYSLVAVGLSDPLPTSPAAEFIWLESGATLPPLVPILVGARSHCPSSSSINSVFAVHGSHGNATLTFISDTLACAALLEGTPLDLDLFETAILDSEECRELHQRALAIRAPLQRILANPELVVTRTGEYSYAWVQDCTRYYMKSSAMELYEFLHRRTHVAADIVPAALAHLTRTLAAASAGRHGILAIDYD